VGDHLDVTRERIRQIESKALRGNASWAAPVKEFRSVFDGLVKKRKKILRDVSRLQKRDAISQIIERDGPLSEEEIQEKFGSEKLVFRDLFSKQERARFLPRQRPKAAYELWTDEEILDVLRNAATMAFPLTVIDYTDLLESNYVDGPSVPTIVNRFRSWGIVCEKAGVESGKTGRTLGSGSKFSEQDLLLSVSEYFEQGRKNTFADYDDWARENNAPSGATLRNRLGTWRDIKKIGLRNVSEHGHED
jgi:hypothetical protein